MMKSLYVLFNPKVSPGKIDFPVDGRASPDESHFISLIHACKETVSLRRVHAQILRGGVLSSRVAAQLVPCSSLLKSPDYSLSIFRHLKEKNLFVFNALIRGLTENARFKCSDRHFILMSRLGVRPDRLTFPFVLKSNSKLGFKWLGMALHAATLKNFVGCDDFVRVSLVDMYAKTGELNYAFQVFEETPERIKKGSWAVHGRFQEAILCFRQMMYSGEKPDEVVFLAVLTACLNAGEVDLGINFFDSMRLDYAIEPTLKHYVIEAPELPLDLVTEEILTRLPAKSLMRFKCVSRQWLSAISSEYFSNRFLTVPSPRLYLNLRNLDDKDSLEILSLVPSSTSSTTPSSFVVDHDLTIPRMGGIIMQNFLASCATALGHQGHISITLPQDNLSPYP
ncbi:unnamed protein product [Thlaspi arvense]|uniref:F-box domain-containing protein n=1 Tax=Thlaspi arvense TaxID=13288 RepID=A0AAU9RHQ8_THLAR|nr:unnamed protein product [Thlaspi arvense]